MKLFNIHPFSVKHVTRIKKLDHYLDEVVLMGRKILKDITTEKYVILFPRPFFVESV